MSEMDNLEKVLLGLLKKRPPSNLERELAEATDKSVESLRYYGLRMMSEIMMGRPMTKKQSHYVFKMAINTLRTNQGYRLWDDDMKYRYWKDFWRWASR